MNRSARSALPLNQHTVSLLGVTVLLTQLPLLLHLPLWICAPGAILVACRILPTLQQRVQLPTMVMTPLVLLGATAIVLHYEQIFSRDPCVAFLFLLVGFKFLESRTSHDASLLVVLSAFLLMTQFFYWQSIAAALSAIPALFCIALALFTLQRGGRSDDPGFIVNITSKLLLQAIPVAMLLFVAVPRVVPPGYGDGSGNSVTGLSSRMSPGSVASLSLSNEVAFRVEFNGHTPAKHELYWRGPVLSGFTGEEWFILPRATHNAFANTTVAESTSSRSLRYTITMEPTSNPWLPALDIPSMLPVRVNSNAMAETIAGITEEKQLNSLVSLNKAVRYTTGSIVTDHFTDSTQPGAEYLLTTSSNPRSKKLARELRARFQDDKALATEILHWFSREEFHYTLSPPSLGENAIDDFLFGTRRGFCEHYAGSFVFMLRAAGIPARVVTGYQGGELNDHYMIVRQSDAHAWAEAYIDGAWHRFDPTASVAPQRVEKGAGAALQGERSDLLNQLPWMRTLVLQWDKLNYRWQSLVIGFDAQLQSRLWQKLGLQQPQALGLVLLVILILAAWITLILVPWRSLLRGKKSDPCQMQWEYFCQGFNKRGVTRLTGETAQAYISRLIENYPHEEYRLTRLLEAYQTGRYGYGSEDKAFHRDSAKTMRTIRKQLGRHR